MTREETYKNFCKYYSIVEWGDTFEKRKQAWLKCNDVAEQGDIDIVELIQWRTDERRENEI